jgi:Raf kinase inhibitor-like YbhB/YbcL family protein
MAVAIAAVPVRRSMLPLRPWPVTLLPHLRAAPRQEQDGYGREVRRAVVGLVLIGLVVSVLAACSGDDASDTQSKTSTTSTTRATPAAMQLTSSDFADNGTIPTRLTCAGAGTPPELFWSAPPRGTDQLALLVFDPDAGTDGFVHYLAWGIGAEQRNASPGSSPVGTRGRNSLGQEGWIPPCPPPGGPHRYQFTLFALDHEPQIAPTANVRQFLDGIEGSVIAEGHLTGRFGR